MKTISIEVSQSEFDAIREYASMCGEVVADLIRKVIIQEITFMKNRGADDPVSYQYNMQIPENTSDDDEKKIIEANYNKIRTILGWSKIRIS